MVKKIRINEDEALNSKPRIKLRREPRSAIGVFRDVRDALRKQGYDTDKLASDFLFYKPRNPDDAYDFVEKYVDIDFVE